MQNMIRNIFVVFIVITTITALVGLSGIIYCWIVNINDLPYLNYIFVSVLLEIAGVVFILVKKGLNYLPIVTVTKDVDQTISFMKKFINNASSVVVVSNKAGWLFSSTDMLETISEKLEKGIDIKIITYKEIAESDKEKIKKAVFEKIDMKKPPNARFTLVNGERGGCEMLAIAKGVYPNHEITVFDSISGPQMISMAKDIIERNK